MSVNLSVGEKESSFLQSYNGRSSKIHKTPCNKGNIFTAQRVQLWEMLASHLGSSSS